MKNVLQKLLIVLVCILLAGNIGLLVCIKAFNFNPFSKTTEKEEVAEVAEEETESKGSSSFTFMGVGDNLIHGAIYYWQQQAGNGYNFDDIYSLTDTYSQSADLAYINAETICAGNIFDLNSYPVFNGPTEILDAVANAGFDWMSIASNHTMDMGDTGLMYEMQYLKDHYPNFTYTGSHLTEEDSNTPTVIEINGIKVGLQSYTYGLNGFSLPEGEEWMINLIDKDEIKRDIEALNEVSDVQIVTMHWGTEYSTDVNDEQKELANYLNELGVDVIVGGHPHVIETGEIIHGEDQDTLCYYSLGNFLSAQDEPERMIGGMASFTLNYDFDTEEVTFSDVKFTPTVTYFDSSFYTFKTTTIHEYTDDMANSHGVAGTSRAFVQQYVQEVFGNPEGFEVVLE